MKNTISLLVLYLISISTTFCQTTPLEVERYELSTDVIWFESKLSDNGKKMYDELMSEFEINLNSFEIFYDVSYVEFMNKIKTESFVYVTYLNHKSNITKSVNFNYKYKDSVEKKKSP